MTKFCTGPCQSEKLLQAFHKGNSLFGYKSQCVECCKRHYDPIKAREARRAHQSRNRDDYRKRSKKYDQTHKAEKAAREAFRRAQKLKATPPWLTKEHKDQMKAIYIERDRLCKLNGIMYHVDHIMPLLGKNMSGLHVPWNLQILTETENLHKSNRVIK
jgi:5-methylcytosine-specific restriction endonuclease McrA